MPEKKKPTGPLVGRDLEATLLALIRAGRTIEAIKNLRAETGCDLAEALSWVVHHPLVPGYTRQSTPCPYCGKPLASERAKQCFSCGMDWHDPTNVVRRGDPNWNRFGLKKTATYVVELCQKPNGERYTKYREVCAAHDPHCVLETEPSLGSRFIEWGFYEYAKHLKLANGGEFGFEAHGIWLTQEEMAYQSRRLRGLLAHGEKPPWVNGLPPLLPPE